LAAILFNSAGDRGDAVLIAFCLFRVEMTLKSRVFFLLNFFDHFIDQCPLQAFIAIDLVSKNFYLLCVFSSLGKVSFNPLTAGIGRIGPGHFPNCPYKRPVNLKI
jgi:hypothetical protein